ncbi:hypothetical protein QVD17_09952 [Tagetes erecta]|uniref:Uncharacterized protein n=1 Tax=Tagetes erecta TaxID=13708 RepID=A0AAD8L5B6_TARER|nr:hypothetical protein QVD17_09952 [Tagetes erecta]
MLQSSSAFVSSIYLRRPPSEPFSTSSTLSHSEASSQTDSEVAMQPNSFQPLTDSEPYPFRGVQRQI